MVYNVMPIQKTNLNQTYICYFSQNRKNPNNINYISSTTFTMFCSQLFPKPSVEVHRHRLTLGSYLTSSHSFLQTALFMRISDLSFKHISCFFNYTDTTDTLFNPI